jgi:endonuclease YncB( thermonuclease family)
MMHPRTNATRCAFARVAALVAALLLGAAAYPRDNVAHGGQARDNETPPLAMPATIAGRVIHVVDGDTLTMLDVEGRQRIVRLSDIDAPEASHGRNRPGQPYSAQATARLKELAHGRAALARCFDVDRRVSDDGQRRDRYVCQVSVGSIDVNLAMLDAGLAMAARQSSRYVRNPASLAREDAARIARRGLWQQPSPVPPWIWRRVCWEQQLCASA